MKIAHVAVEIERSSTVHSVNSYSLFTNPEPIPVLVIPDGFYRESIPIAIMPDIRYRESLLLVIPDSFYRESILVFFGWIPATSLRG